MSLGGIGGYGSHDLSKVLSTLLSRLDTKDDAKPAPAADDSNAANAGSGRKGWHRGEARLSSNILNVLLRLQQQEGPAPTPPATDPAATGDTTAASQSTPDSPIHRLFVAIDADGDGSATKEEFETFIQAKGGTQDEADKLFALLDKDGTGSLSEEQLTAAIKRGHHGHHYGWLARPNAERLFGKLDANGDGSLTKDEFEAFVTERGGKAERADKFFAKLDADGDGAVDQAAFTQAVRHGARRPHVHHGAPQGGESESGADSA